MIGSQDCKTVRSGSRCHDGFGAKAVRVAQDLAFRV